MLDFYFKRPVLWDYTISLFIAIICLKLVVKKIIELPEKATSLGLTTDLTNIALTLSGFVLTILTVLITFKSTIDEEKREEENKINIFKAFFSSSYYSITITHLKNCIKSILTIAVLGFIVRLFVYDDYKEYSFYFNIFGLTVIFLTIWRCLLILSKVLSFQKTI